jgi:hypothetical protein
MIGLPYYFLEKNEKFKHMLVYFILNEIIVKINKNYNFFWIRWVVQTWTKKSNEL